MGGLGRRCSKHRLRLVSAAAAVVLMAGCGGDSGGAPSQAGGAAHHDRFAYARSIFREICAGCHTLADAGTRGTDANLDDTVFARIEPSARPAALRQLFEEQGRYMPRWKGRLSDRELAALTDYLAAVVGHPRSGRISEPLPRLSRENAGPGRFAYARARFAQACGGCHTLADARTHGRRDDLDTSTIADRSLSFSVRKQIARETIREGRPQAGGVGSMPAWTLVLKPEDIDEMAAYLATVAGGK